MGFFIAYVVVGLVVGTFAWLRHGADRWPMAAARQVDRNEFLPVVAARVAPY